MLTRVLEIVVWSVGVLLTLIWAVGVRVKTAQGQGVQPATATIAAFFVVALIVTFTLGSGFHLLWLFPLAVLLGSPLFPFFHSIGSVYGNLVNLGIDMRKARQKHQVIKEFGQMLVNGSSGEEAARTICERYPDLVAEIGKEPFLEEAEFVARLKQMYPSADEGQSGAG